MHVQSRRIHEGLLGSKRIENDRGSRELGPGVDNMG